MKGFFYKRSITVTVFFALVATASGADKAGPRIDPGQVYQPKADWSHTMQACREALQRIDLPDKERIKLSAQVYARVLRDFPVRADWMLQDYGRDAYQWFLAQDNRSKQIRMIEQVLEELGQRARAARARLTRLKDSAMAGDDSRWFELYEEVCTLRRERRLGTLLARQQRIVFTKHFNMGGSHYAYTEGQSDAQAERSFKPGTSLCILTMDGLYGRVETLIEDAQGVIRDPDVSYDGKAILFAWKKSDRQDDYHLYEMDVDSRRIKQITSGLGFADYEACYLPTDDIIFNSTRCVQIVDCWWTEVSNLYTCDRDGQFMRRLLFDQVHSNFPAVMDDGKVIYTRWDYNDRGQLYPQPLYNMNADGTGQAEFYGNSSWFPTTILHARGIPGTGKVLAIATGHHSRQTGKLIIVDPTKGRQENEGVQLIAPIRETKAEKIDAYGQHGELFQYPYALSETDYLVTYSPLGWSQRPTLFGIYHMTIDGKRELLAADADISCNQSVPLSPRRRPYVRPSLVDYRQDSGTYYVQDIYQGPGLKDVPRGTIKKLRVVEIQFRAAGVGSNNNGGPAGGALVSTPIAIRNGCWDVKVVLGDAEVYADGSACFSVPARTPVYFQALDEKGYVIQSMRTWSTLQPGETLSCVGCHENKDETPMVATKVTVAMKRGAQALAPFYGPARGFSFNREIQPILDKHCIGCHNDRTKKPGTKASKTDHGVFSLLDAPNPDKGAGRIWSDAYLALTSHGKPEAGPVRWLNVQSIPPMLPPEFAGAVKSPLIAMLEKGHNDVKLDYEEMEKIACWIDLLVPYCGDYLEANCWDEGGMKKYLRFQGKRDNMAKVEAENITKFIAPQQPARNIMLSVVQHSNAYRNVAYNPRAAQGYARSWPHASSNSEYHDMPAFAAGNAINGKTANQGHGRAFPSWGPDKQRDLWWKLDFGRLIETDKIVLYIRADFPHDDFWHNATIAFSDGSTESIKLQKTAEPQVFEFKRRDISWLRLTELQETEPLGWCALTEVEVWGKDVVTPAAHVLAQLSPNQ
jgi:hypothetical protein